MDTRVETHVLDKDKQLASIFFNDLIGRQRIVDPFTYGLHINTSVKVEHNTLNPFL
jgi:hypothetical protein